MAFSTGATSKSFISAVSLLDKREILKNAVDIYNEEGLMDILQLAGRQVETKEPVYHDYSEDALAILLDTTGATVTGSGSASVTTTLTAATSGFVRKGDKIVFPNGKVGQVQSVNTASSQDTIVIKSTDGTNLTHTAGQKLSPLGITVGEKSTAPTNQRFGWTKYQNQVETFREKNEITDIQLGSEIEIEYDGQPYVFNRDIANKFMKFKGHINATFIAGRASTALYSDASGFVDPGNGGNEQFTMGLNQYTTTYGVNANGAGAGTTGALALTDFESFFNSMTAARAKKKNMAYMSSAVGFKVSNCLKALGSASVQSGRLSLDGKTLDFDVEKLIYGGFETQFGTLPIFDHPVIVSQTDIVKSIFFIPEGKVATKKGGAEDYIRVRYMKQQMKGGFGNDIYSEWDTGALARGGATSDEMVRNTHWISTQGTQFLGGQHFGKLVVL